MLTTEEYVASASIPTSRLGYSTGRSDFDGSELFIAIKCYFDGSEGIDVHGDIWITLAGFAAPDKSWEGFDRTWDRMLHERYPIAPYIHMWQIVAGEDPFERVNGWTKDRVFSLVSDAVELLRNRQSLHSFSCRVNLTARQRLIKEGHKVFEPAALCADMCHALSRKWSLTKRLESVYLFFDRGERFMQPLKDQWLTNRTPPNKIATDETKRVWDLIANIQEDDMERNPPLQAADIMAWATSRDLAKKLTALYDLDQYMNNLIVDHHAVIDETLLREKYLL
jgi:hypothetical protein